MNAGKFLLLLLLAVFSLHTGVGQAPVTVASLLTEMIDVTAQPKFPQPAFTMKQASSYDRRSVAEDQPGWFANSDYNQFIRKEQRDGHSENVMMDADGPGAIVRFWLTTVVKPGTLRFYLDYEALPSIEIPAYDLLKAGFDLGPALLNPHSSYEPDGKGGNTLYLPIPFQKHCKVTFEFADSATEKTPHYYQINYRTYAPGTQVQTFTKSDLINYRASIDKAETILWASPVYKKGRLINWQQLIKAKNEYSFQLPQGNAAIRYITIEVKTNDSNSIATALRSLILKINFDGAQTVWCPAGDFAGSGYGGKFIKSWYREITKEGKIISRWVMPYQRSASIGFINLSSFPVDVAVSVNVDKWKWDSSSMYFHTSYKFEKNIRDAKWDYDVSKVAKNDTAAPIEWNLVKIKGKGIYLGNTLAVDNHMQTWYGEGDAKLWVDNDVFPSEFGTGLEDYYNTSWAPVVLYQTPFANAPRADNQNSFGHNTFTRTRNLDGVPFMISFKYNLEMLSWDGGTIDAAATVYWYGAAGATDR